MHADFENVNDAFSSIVAGIADGVLPTVRGPSRVGEVLTIPEPVILTFNKPLERVLFNVYRDANPFFHLYEAMWMLAGRNDIAPLEYYSSNYGDFVRDDDNPDIANGAYGYRWRNAMVAVDKDCEDIVPVDRMENVITANGIVDQLDVIINHLKQQPNSRRVVLQMWNVEDDLLKIDTSKDVCCNTNVYFLIRDGLRAENPSSNIKYKFLDMTVCNRSNDIVLGMLGANYVHFSFLQEYIANSLGVDVGVYHQFSNNAHVYTERFKPDEWLKQAITMFDHENDNHLIYNRSDRVHIPLVKNRQVFDDEVCKFVTLNKDAKDITAYADYSEPFLSRVAQPMMHAFHMHKARDYSAALRWLAHVDADDWRIAGINWITKRKVNYEQRVINKNPEGKQDA